MDHSSDYLTQSLVFLFSAVFFVSLSHRLGLGSIAGYLFAGIAIGPLGMGWVEKVEDVRHFAELGVVLLLFAIGLELEPKRLWNMRARLLTLGVSQVVGSIMLIMLATGFLGIGSRAGMIVGMALALSSTALALQPLTERGALASKGGQAVFSILLFQDLAVIPMLAVLPLLSGPGTAVAFSWEKLGVAGLVITTTLVGGHFLAQPVFRYIARTRQKELFTAFALALVLAIAMGFEAAGLSMALGTFLAGVLLAESEYRHEIEAAVEPFKGLLLGLFFISVGMSVDFRILVAQPLLVIGALFGLFLTKGLVLWGIARLSGISPNERPLFVMLLAQGGEFAFVLLAMGSQQSVLEPNFAGVMTLVVALSMLCTPFFLLIYDRYFAARFVDEKAPVYAAAKPEEGQVIVAGLGRVGQVVARMLHASGYEPTILDDDPDHVEQSRLFGFRVFYGDATRVDLLQSAGASRADYLIVALDDPAAITRLVKVVVKHFPRLKIISRARDMKHLFELKDLGVTHIQRETFDSALSLAQESLAALCGSRERALRAAQAFSSYDKVVLTRLYEVHNANPETRIAVSNQLRDDFSRLMNQGGEWKQEDVKGSS